MRYGEIKPSKLTLEARKNPEKNPKVSVNQKFYDLYDKADVENIGDRQRTNLFLSMTELDKLGVNPKSPYYTPIGIYAYPADYVLDKLVEYHGGSRSTETPNAPMGQVLPFAGGSAYANFFIIKPNYIGNIVALDESVDGEMVHEYYLKLFKYVKQKYGRIAFNEYAPSDDIAPDLLDVDVFDPDELDEEDFETHEEYLEAYEQAKEEYVAALEDAYEREIEYMRENFDVINELEYDIEGIVADAYNFSEKGAKVRSPAGQLWFLFYQTSRKLAARTKSKASVIWTQCCMECDISGFIDPGNSIIHESEPNQAVFFSLKYISPIERIHNKYDAKAVKASKQKQQTGSQKYDVQPLIDEYVNGALTTEQVATTLTRASNVYRREFLTIVTPVNRSEFIEDFILIAARSRLKSPMTIMALKYIGALNPKEHELNAIMPDTIFNKSKSFISNALTVFSPAVAGNYISANVLRIINGYLKKSPHYQST